MASSDKIISCLIIDDWESAHTYLKDMLRPYKQIKIVGHCYNTFDAIKAIEKQKPNLVFLDVENVPYSGLEMLSKIPTGDFKVIFVTADPRLITEPKDPRIVSVLPKLFGPAVLRRTLLRL